MTTTPKTAPQAGPTAPASAPLSTPPASLTPAPTAPQASALSPAQRAVLTRRANQGLGTTPSGLAIAPKAGKAPRAAGMVLELWVVSTESSITLFFRPTNAEGNLMSSGLAESEAGLHWLRWQAFAFEGQTIGDFDTCTLKEVQSWGVAGLETVLPLMRRTDKLIGLARSESEDTSLAFVAGTLAAHFQVGTVKAQAPDGTVTSHKRGAAYVTAHRAGEALIASQAAADKKAA